MTNILVTGSDGFIGQNLCAALERDAGIRLLRYDIGGTRERLMDFVGRADFIFHLAGTNRPPDAAGFDSGNRGFTERLLSLIEDVGRKPSLAFASSTQAVLDNPYGVSKKAAEDAVRAWSQRSGESAFIYRLPNVFGKWSRPNYNSAVATFCHNLARGLPIQLHDAAAKLSLVYIDDVVADFLSALGGRRQASSDGFCHVRPVFETTVGAVAELIGRFAHSRDTLVMPLLSGDFECDLYATYISFLPEDGLSYPLDAKRDGRGWLAELIKSDGFGQIFISQTKPGVTRGNHWHQTKTEKFFVIRGEGLVKLRKVGSQDVLEYRVSGEKPEAVDIPPGYAHCITNTSDTDLITLFWSDQIFDPQKPDTFFLEV
ncbi:MAG: NAD-dependent epimerase/dehydratase family protein [Clostridia bacterium]|nr:NAD-dependent epimerase/dehydratase family protein [Clostridia bacterium]